MNRIERIHWYLTQIEDKMLILYIPKTVIFLLSTQWDGVVVIIYPISSRWEIYSTDSIFSEFN